MFKIIPDGYLSIVSFLFVFLTYYCALSDYANPGKYFTQAF
jgi:hypothetical protein